MIFIHLPAIVFRIMNFLAHLYLTKDLPEKVSIGNFMADAVKGRNALDRYPAEIHKGILIHREIDDFTNKHTLFQQGTRRLHNTYGKYAGVILDIFYDYFLAVNWDQYCEIDLAVFARSRYQMIDRYMHYLPDRTLLWFAYMKQHDLLFNYSREEGISFVLRGMDRRTGGISGMGGAIKELKDHQESFNREFISFFADIQSYLKSHYI